jgi:hypothetical protein
MTYSVVNLSLPTGATGSGANSINASGQIAGSYYNDGEQAAAVWSASGAITVLSGLASSAEAVGINASGETCGNVSNGDTQSAYLWSATGAATLLSDPGGEGWDQAVAINNHGWVAGISKTATGNESVLWSPNGKAHVLPAIDGSENNTVFAINPLSPYVYGVSNNEAVKWGYNGLTTDVDWVSPDAGSEVLAAVNDGASAGFDGDSAALWGSSGVETLLTNPSNLAPGSQAEALAMNNAPHIQSGWSAGFAGADAVLWSPTGSPTELDNPGDGAAEALAINATKYTVGFFDGNSGTVAALWNPEGGVTNLDAILGSGWTDTVATGIANDRSIVGHGDLNGSAAAFELIWTPAGVPEASAGHYADVRHSVSGALIVGHNS